MNGFGSNNAPPNSALANGYELRWHKFQVNFALWAGAILNFITGCRFISGDVYEEQSSQVYEYFEGLRSIDSIWGVIMLAIAIYMIYVRFQLAGLRTNAPRKLSIMYLLFIAGNLIYIFAVSNITRLPLVTILQENPGGIIGFVVMLFINMHYYKKRAALFIN